jgi:predicted transglutaminase-like cysteine proteinase
MKILIFFFIYVNLTYSNILLLTNKEKDFIKKSSNRFIVARRINNYYKFLNRLKEDTLNKKLIQTNLYINKIRPKNDLQGTNTWSTPKEFLINGYGDCEDYAIMKYVTLVYLGIPKEKLYLSVVQVKGYSDLHMVLIYLSKNNNYLVLDNLSWKILPINKRKDLRVKYLFNDKSSYKFDINFNIIKEHKIKRKDIKLLEHILLEFK